MTATVNNDTLLLIAQTLQPIAFAAAALNLALHDGSRRALFAPRLTPLQLPQTF